MSHYLDIKTQITDLECLVEALCRIETRTGQWNKNKIEVHETPQNLYGYQGDVRSQKANVIIRKLHVGGASNDIGFLKSPDGTYTSIISEFDRRFYNLLWSEKLSTYYGVEKAKKEFKVKGIKYTETVDEKGRIQLRAKIQEKGMY